MTEKNSDNEKRIYISADYSEDDGDREVIEILDRWGKDNLHSVNFVDTSHVVSGSVEKDPDCRPCDLKDEFNRQIKASSVVIFVIGDKTAKRIAGSICNRSNVSTSEDCQCTPYKQNRNGTQKCKVNSTVPVQGNYIGPINRYSYIRHEFETAKKQKKKIMILYNSLREESQWLPSYMQEYVNSYPLLAMPFWQKNFAGEKTGNYVCFKRLLEQL